MKTLTLLLVLAAHTMVAQQRNIAQFVVWKPKEGKAQDFETGYKQHLLWHKANKDPWGWYGWFFISGPRDGQFIDATIDHAWGDFEHSIKPADDRADNVLHVYPHGDVQSVVKAACLKELGTADNEGLKSKFVRMVTLEVTDIPGGIKLVRELKTRLPLRHLQVYKPVDGGSINQLILLMGFAGYEEYGKAENLQEELSSIETRLGTRTVKGIISETLVYRADMSLFPD